MPFYAGKDSSPLASRQGKESSPLREKVAVSTIRYELEPAPHRMLDSDADIKNLSNPGRSSIDTGFGGLAPRIIVTENNTAKNTIIPKHAQPISANQIDKVMRENDALKKENNKLKSAANMEWPNKVSNDKIVSSPTIVMTPSLGRPTPTNAHRHAPPPEPIHDSSKNILDLRQPGMDSFQEESRQDEDFEASFEPPNKHKHPRLDPQSVRNRIFILMPYILACP